ncbi:MAG TPA: hypothetical protein VGE51_03160 [Fontimonas sp.]
MNKETNQLPLQYSKTGSRPLPLRQIACVPPRNDVSVYGKRFEGDAPQVRELPGRVHAGTSYRADDLRVEVQRNSAFQGSSNYNSVFAFDTERIYLTYRDDRGTRHFEVNCPALRAQVSAVLALDDDAAHAVLLCIVQAQLAAAAYGYQQARHDYERAYVDGRLRKKKLRGTDSYSIYIESLPRGLSAAA